MLFIILLYSGSSVFTFTIAFFLAPLDRCDRRGGDGLRSSSDPDEAESLSSDSELSELLSESENFRLLLAFRSFFFLFPYPVSHFLSPPSVVLRVYTRLDLLVLRKGVVRMIGVTVGVSSL
jgi:hypothetical protein